jgi:hypothetical protein
MSSPSGSQAVSITDPRAQVYSEAIMSEMKAIDDYLFGDTARILNVASMVRTGALEKAIKTYTAMPDDSAATEVVVSSRKRARGEPLDLPATTKEIRTIRMPMLRAALKGCSEHVKAEVEKIDDSDLAEQVKCDIFKNWFMVGMHASDRSKLDLTIQDYEKISVFVRLCAWRYDNIGRRLEDIDAANPLNKAFYVKGPSPGEFVAKYGSRSYQDVSFQAPVPHGVDLADIAIQKAGSPDNAYFDLPMFPRVSLMEWFKKSEARIPTTIEPWNAPVDQFPRKDVVAAPLAEVVAANGVVPPTGNGRSRAAPKARR